MEGWKGEGASRKTKIYQMIKSKNVILFSIFLILIGYSQYLVFLC